MRHLFFSRLGGLKRFKLTGRSCSWQPSEPARSHQRRPAGDWPDESGQEGASRPPAHSWSSELTSGRSPQTLNPYWDETFELYGACAVHLTPAG